MCCFAGFFLTKIFHPNVASNGAICVNTLKRDWKPEHGIRHILLVMLYTTSTCHSKFVLQRSTVVSLYLDTNGTESVLITEVFLGCSSRGVKCV